MAPRSIRRADRGQTLPDFAVGISIFLVTLVFVVGFIPQITAPYAGQATPVIVDRAGSDIAADLRAAGGPPSTFDEECTLALFGYANASACPFDPTDPLTTYLSIPSHYAVNVSIRDGPSDDPNSELLCADTSTGTIEPCGTDRLARGPPVPGETHSVASTRRAGVVNGTDVVLEVRVW